MTSIVDDYAEIRRNAHSRTLYERYAHVYNGAGWCVHCRARRNSPAVLYGTHCTRSPGADRRNGHDFTSGSGRCADCLAGQSSTAAKEYCLCS